MYNNKFQTIIMLNYIFIFKLKSDNSNIVIQNIFDLKHNTNISIIK